MMIIQLKRILSFTLEKSVDTDPRINLNRTTGYLIILDDSNDGMFHYYNILRQSLMHINNIECLLIIIIFYMYTSSFNILMLLFFPVVYVYLEAMGPVKEEDKYVQACAVLIGPNPVNFLFQTQLLTRNGTAS